MKSLKKSFEFAMTGPLATLTLITSALSLCRLAVDVFTIPMSAIFAKLLDTYRSIFHALFDILASFVAFDISVSAWLKDIILIYIFFGFLYQRIVWRQIPFNYHHPWYIKHRSKDSKLAFIGQSIVKMGGAILLWLFRLPDLLRSPHLIVGLGAHGPSAMCLSSSHPGGEPRTIYYGDGRIIMLFRLLGTIAGVCILLALNYALT